MTNVQIVKIAAFYSISVFIESLFFNDTVFVLIVVKIVFALPTI
jgi:hypothetical protein